MAKEIKLIDYQSFITSEARQRYYESVGNKYAYVCFRDIQDLYYLYLYDDPNEFEEDWKVAMQRDFDIMGAYAND